MLCGAGCKLWSNAMEILEEKDGVDTELLVYAMTLINKVGLSSFLSLSLHLFFSLSLCIFFSLYISLSSLCLLFLSLFLHFYISLSNYIYFYISLFTTLSLSPK
jgi:hypothetical protein